MSIVSAFSQFTIGSARVVTRGSAAYFAWIFTLLALIAIGGWAYWGQFNEGLIETGMRDPVSWGFYIGNFTFLVGVAAAAVILVIPAYVYKWKPIKEIALFGELLAVSAIAMCMLFVLVDMGRPDRLLHIMPFVGNMNLPRSMLAWDVVVLNGYFYLNLFVVTYMLVSYYRGKEPNKRIFTPLVLLSIPAAVTIHTVTAFVYSGIPGRPFWNASILAPRFLVSAFCSGPAVMIVLLQILRRVTKIDIKKEAIWKIAELMAYAMFINLFFLAAEVFKEVYSDTHHLKHLQYLFVGLGEKTALVPWAWTSVVFSIVAFFLFLIPKTRQNFVTLNVGCALIFVGIFIEKGIGLVVPGYTPSVLGEIYEYEPTATEILVSAGIFGVGALLFTLTSRVAIAVVRGDFRMEAAPEA
jgi:molybdopterin-containing oxidoreductase family membrane subunit